jgi:hypothetical protein
MWAKHASTSADEKIQHELNMRVDEESWEMFVHEKRERKSPDGPTSTT